MAVSKGMVSVGYYLSYVTGFTKRGLPHTSNSMNLKIHILVINKHINLKFAPSTKLWWHSLLAKFQVNSLFQSDGVSRQI